MSVSFDDFLSYTKTLNTGKGEIEVRACISRSYYSAYHCAVDYINVNPIELIGGEGGVHKRLISHFELSKDNKVKGIGFALRALKEKRVIADYHLLEDLQLEDSEASLLDAERLINMISEINT